MGMRTGPGRRSFRRVGVLAAVVLVALALPTAGQAGSAPAARSVTVSKTTDLVDKEEVTITWEGFTPGAEVYVHQCANPPTGWSDCAEVSRHVATSGPDGTGTTRYRVTAGDLLQWDSTERNRRLRCDGSSCAIALSECGVDLAADVTRVTPIAIRPGAAPPPIAPDPETGDLPFAQAPIPPVVEPPGVVAEPPRAPVTLPRITGGGASGARHLMLRWQTAAVQPPSSVAVDYIATNSPTGNEQFVSGLGDFAVTAEPLTAAEVAQLGAAGRGFAYAPVAASGLAVAFNMFAHNIRQTKLNLRADHLAQLYGNAGGFATIRNPEPGQELNGLLSHPTVRAVNNGCTFDASGEAREAQALFRTDRSSGNRFFTRYLATRGSLWTAGELAEFPSAVTTGATGTDGLAERVTRPRTPGAGEAPSPLPERPNQVPMGYVDVSQVALREMTAAGVENAAGAFVRPTPEALGAAFEGAIVGADGMVELPGVTAAAAYPIPVVYYLVVPTTTSSSFTASMGDALRAFLTYAVSDAGQRQAAELGMVPLSPALRAASLATAARIPTTPPAPPATGPTTTTTTAAAGPGSGEGGQPTGSQPSGGGSGEVDQPAGAGGASPGETAATSAPGGLGPSVFGARVPSRFPVPRPTSAGPPPGEEQAPVAEPRNEPGPFDDLLRAPSALLRGASFVPTVRSLLVVGLVVLLAGRLARRRLGRS